MFEIDPACLIDPQLGIPNKNNKSAALNTSISTFQFPDCAVLSARQTLYSVTQFKSYLRSFVSENQTSFIHPSLYQSTFPPTYQDVLGICSLYNHKTSSNQSTIFRMLDSKIATLIQTSGSLLYNLEGNLLALQALILYQLIRLFDGDPRQRSNGERHLELLDSWTLRLQQNLNDTFDTTAVCGGGYRQWVLEESVRRTTMMSVVLRSLYGFMKFGVCELVPLLATLPVSKNSKLWKSPERIVRGNGKENGLLSY
jgi:hypothetical protein